MKAAAMVAAGDHSMTVEEAVKFINHPQFASAFINGLLNVVGG